MTETINNADIARIAWYRSPIDPALLKELTQRSDLRGLGQAGGHLLILLATGSLAIWSAGAWPWYVTVLLVWVHGTVWSFLNNAFHELVHGTVFRSKRAGQIFLNLVSFLGQYNPVHFWASHTDHHKFTLYPPRDLEVVLPVVLTFRGFLQRAFFNPWGILRNFRQHGRQSRGVLSGEWEKQLFPDSDPGKKQGLKTWARVLFYGHGFILLTTVTLAAVTRSPHWAAVPFVITFAPHTGGWLQYLLNDTQHLGMTGQVPDYRLCSRTIRLNPVVEFLYWHMNYHIEHHMFAAVPCYRLGKLHRAIGHDLPRTPVGILDTWKDVSAILRRQKTDPDYEFTPLVPNPSFGGKTRVMEASPRA